MPERESLTTISIITDDDTGMYEIGEIDGCFSEAQLERHLNMRGATKLLEHLARLMAKVVEVDMARRPTEECKSANSAKQ